MLNGASLMRPEALDACIIRFANAKRACYDASCSSCVTGLHEVEAACLVPCGNVSGTPRGKHFVDVFRNYRYNVVAKQCLRSVDQGHKYDIVLDVECGGNQVRIMPTAPMLRARVHHPRERRATPIDPSRSDMMHARTYADPVRHPAGRRHPKSVAPPI